MVQNKTKIFTLLLLTVTLFSLNTTAATSACIDGNDNDNEGLVDENDPGCTKPYNMDKSEGEAWDTDATALLGGPNGPTKFIPGKVHYGAGSTTADSGALEEAYVQNPGNDSGNLGAGTVATQTVNGKPEWDVVQNGFLGLVGEAEFIDPPRDGDCGDGTDDGESSLDCPTDVGMAEDTGESTSTVSDELKVYEVQEGNSPSNGDNIYAREYGANGHGGDYSEDITGGSGGKTFNADTKGAPDHFIDSDNRNVLRKLNVETSTEQVWSVTDWDAPNDDSVTDWDSNGQVNTDCTALDENSTCKVTGTAYTSLESRTVYDEQLQSDSETKTVDADWFTVSSDGVGYSKNPRDDNFQITVDRNVRGGQNAINYQVGGTKSNTYKCVEEKTPTAGCDMGTSMSYTESDTIQYADDYESNTVTYSMERVSLNSEKVFDTNDAETSKNAKNILFNRDYSEEIFHKSTGGEGYYSVDKTRDSLELGNNRAFGWSKFELTVDGNQFVSERTDFQNYEPDGSNGEGDGLIAYHEGEGVVGSKTDFGPHLSAEDIDMSCPGRYTKCIAAVNVSLNSFDTWDSPTNPESGIEYSIAAKAGTGEGLSACNIYNQLGGDVQCYYPGTDSPRPYGPHSDQPNQYRGVFGGPAVSGEVARRYPALYETVMGARSVDVVFAIDDSLSMNPYIKELQTNTEEFIDKLPRGTKAGMFSYAKKTGGGDAEPGTINHKVQFTEDLSKIKSTMEDAWSQTHCCVEEEDVALKTAIQDFDWRESSRKMIILLASEPVTQDLGTSKSPSEWAEIAEDKGITVYSIADANGGGEDNGVTKGRYGEIAKSTGGRYYPINSDYQQILDDVAGQVENSCVYNGSVYPEGSLKDIGKPVEVTQGNIVEGISFEANQEGARSLDQEICIDADDDNVGEWHDTDTSEVNEYLRDNEDIAPPAYGSHPDSEAASSTGVIQEGLAREDDCVGNCSDLGTTGVYYSPFKEGVPVDDANPVDSLTQDSQTETGPCEVQVDQQQQTQQVQQSGTQRSTNMFSGNGGLEEIDEILDEIFGGGDGDEDGEDDEENNVPEDEEEEVTNCVNQWQQENPVSSELDVNNEIVSAGVLANRVQAGGETGHGAQNTQGQELKEGQSLGPLKNSRVDSKDDEWALTPNLSYVIANDGTPYLNGSCYGTGDKAERVYANSFATVQDGNGTWVNPDNVKISATKGGTTCDISTNDWGYGYDPIVKMMEKGGKKHGSIKEVILKGSQPVHFVYGTDISTGSSGHQIETGLWTGEDFTIDISGKPTKENLTVTSGGNSVSLPSYDLIAGKDHTNGGETKNYQVFDAPKAGTYSFEVNYNLGANAEPGGTASSEIVFKAGGEQKSKTLTVNDDEADAKTGTFYLNDVSMDKGQSATVELSGYYCAGCGFNVGLNGGEVTPTYESHDMTPSFQVGADDGGDDDSESKSQTKTVFEAETPAVYKIGGSYGGSVIGFRGSGSASINVKKCTDSGCNSIYQDSYSAGFGNSNYFDGSSFAPEVTMETGDKIKVTLSASASAMMTGSASGNINFGGGTASVLHPATGDTSVTINGKQTELGNLGGGESSTVTNIDLRDGTNVVNFTTSKANTLSYRFEWTEEPPTSSSTGICLGEGCASRTGTKDTMLDQDAYLNQSGDIMKGTLYTEALKTLQDTRICIGPASECNNIESTSGSPLGEENQETAPGFTLDVPYVKPLKSENLCIGPENNC
ncbi:MAG: VWA domain-containing protein [Candidatus Nanohalobium sp.]